MVGGWDRAGGQDCRRRLWSGGGARVDGDDAALQRGRALLADAGVTNADLRQGRADDIGLNAGTFDTVVLRHVLAHNDGAEQRIVDHLATLVRPGGFVYLVDLDLSAMRMQPLSPDLADLTPKYVDFHAGRGTDPQIGPRLSELASAAGLTVTRYRGWFDITVAPVGIRPPSCLGSRRRAVGCCFEELDQAQERPLMFPALFAAIARRPE